VKLEPPIINPNEISYIEGDNYSIDVFFDEKDKDKETKTATLAFMERNLDPAVFRRINKKIIIHLGKVKEQWITSQGLVVKMKDGNEFTVSELFLDNYKVMMPYYPI
jgi:DNA-binding LytR/AlgR family response regulator